MALDFWFVTYTLQKSVILREKKIKKKKTTKKQPDSSRICSPNFWGQIQSHGSQRKFPDGFHKKDLSYQQLTIAGICI